MIRLVKMNKNHIDDVLKVENECFSTPWGREAFVGELNFDGRTHYIVAFEGETIIGYCGMWMCDYDISITNIAVSPSHRKKGIGLKLLTALMDEAIANGGTTFTLEVRPSNFSAINLYEKLGFVQIGIRKGYYDDGEDAYLMQCVK